MFDAEWKIFKTSFYVHLSSLERNKNAYILIEYGDMPDFHAKSIMNENFKKYLLYLEKIYQLFSKLYLTVDPWP